jgi:3-hydroxyisobutyrate dehydrogenase-like beta-hydroxyacid dehydrogenase
MKGATDLGWIGLGKMGCPLAKRLLALMEDLAGIRS